MATNGNQAAHEPWCCLCVVTHLKVRLSLDKGQEVETDIALVVALSSWPFILESLPGLSSLFFFVSRLSKLRLELLAMN